MALIGGIPLLTKALNGMIQAEHQLNRQFILVGQSEGITESNGMWSDKDEKKREAPQPPTCYQDEAQTTKNYRKETETDQAKNKVLVLTKSSQHRYLFGSRQRQ